jgi:DNA processing protein
MANNQSEIYYRIALNFVPGIGAKTSNTLLEYFGSAKDILQASEKELVRVQGMGKVKAKACKDKHIYKLAEEEIKFAQKNDVTLLFKGDKAYPERLTYCVDAPNMLYYKGSADLNAKKVISIVGTRRNTDYGLRLCSELIEDLADEKDVLIVSGLAKGIDAIAHQASLQHQLSTIGVMAHGLNMIYPASNKGLARHIVERGGGLLTEFGCGSKLERGNFPARNRIVAGLADVTVVVESGERGGALITAQMAQSYNRDVAAFPGRVYDQKSIGNNELIRKNVAALIENGDDLRVLMNWKEKSMQKKKAACLPQLSIEEQQLFAAIGKIPSIHADDLATDTGIGSDFLSEALLELEFKGLIKSLPGNYYRLR